MRYHHLIDPDRGEPARGCRSVTIVADRAVLADVLSTGVFIMGPADGMALIERLPDVEGVIVTATNEVLISSGLKGRVADCERRRQTRRSGRHILRRCQPLTLDLVQTVAFAGVILFLGYGLRRADSDPRRG